MTNIRIVRPPIGPAPLEIRAAWIGVSLPTAIPQRRRWLCNLDRFHRSPGITSWLRTLFSSHMITGYAVESAVAIAILKQAAPDAAKWWETNTPYLLQRGRMFVFDAASCEEVPAITWPPPPDVRQ